MVKCRCCMTVSCYNKRSNQACMHQYQLTFLLHELRCISKQLHHLLKTAESPQLHVTFINWLSLTLYKRSCFDRKAFFFFVSVVNECRKVLSAAGFKELKEKEHWDIKPSDKVRNESWCFIFNFLKGYSLDTTQNHTMVTGNKNSVVWEIIWCT